MGFGIQRQNSLKFKIDSTVRRKLVASLLILKMSQTEIMATLEQKGFPASQANVSRDIKYVLEEWKKDTTYDIENLKLRELASLDKLELETNVLFKETKIKDSKSEVIRIIETLLKIQERRSKLMGLDTPEKMDIKAEHSGQIVINLTRTSCRKEPSENSGE